jgi:hypothetical protein
MHCYRATPLSRVVAWKKNCRATILHMSVARHCTGCATSKWARPLDQSTRRAWRGALSPQHRHRHNGGDENGQCYRYAARSGVGSSHTTNACECWHTRRTQRRSIALPCHVKAVRKPAAARRAAHKACSAMCGPTWSVRGDSSSSSFNTKQVAVFSPRCIPSRIDHIATTSFPPLPISGRSKCGAHISRPSSGEIPTTAANIPSAHLFTIAITSFFRFTPHYTTTAPSDGPQ